MLDDWSAVIDNVFKHQLFKTIKRCFYFQVYFNTPPEQPNLIARQRSGGVFLLETDK